MDNLNKNNWYVITGAPCSGKTTLLNFLTDRGFTVLQEVARIHIDEEMAHGKTLKEIRADELAFQRKILNLKIDREKNLPGDKIIFFDRGIPDSDAYYKLQGIENDSFMNETMNNCYYKKVFLLEPYDYDKDYARTETKEEQLKLHEYLEESYKKIGAEIIKVPRMAAKIGRVEFVLKNL
jgi:predicted ATPase